MKKLNLIILDDDVIEILHNENLTKNPYWIRLYNYANEKYEIRASEDDLKEFAKIINDLLLEQITD